MRRRMMDCEISGMDRRIRQEQVGDDDDDDAPRNPAGK
jgi:hypothetical protein